MRKLILALLLIAFCISPAMAVDYTFGDDEPVDIVYDVNNDFAGFDFLVAYAGTTDEITLFDPSGFGSQSLKVDNLQSDITCVAILDGDIVAGFSNGDVIRFSIGAGIFDYATATADNMQLITQLPSACTDIIVDGTDNIYVSSDKYVYKFSAPYYSQATLITESINIKSLANHPDGLLYGTGGFTKHSYVKLYESSSTTTTLFDGYNNGEIGASDCGEIQGIKATSNGDVYFNIAYNKIISGSDYRGRIRLMRLNYSDSYSATSQYYEEVGSSSTGSVAYTYAVDRGYKDLDIENNGIIFTVMPYSDKISTYSTIGLIGGYCPTSGSTSDTSNPLIDYDGDGEVTQDDMKNMAVNYGPVLLGMMAFLFFMVAMSGRD